MALAKIYDFGGKSQFLAFYDKFQQNRNFSLKKDPGIFLNQRSDRFYNFTFVPMSVTQLILQTAPRIFPKLGIKLGDNKVKKIPEPIFWEKFSFCPNLAKCAEKWPFRPEISVFGTLQKNDFNKFSKIVLKVGPKIVL